MTETIPTLEEYIKMLERHDWTYDYSDDPKVWAKGHASKAKLVAIAEQSAEHKSLYNEYLIAGHPYPVPLP